MASKEKPMCINCRFGRYWKFRKLSENTSPLVEGVAVAYRAMPATGQCCRYAPHKPGHDVEHEAPVLATHWCGDHRWKNRRWWQR